MTEEIIEQTSIENKEHTMKLFVTIILLITLSGCTLIDDLINPWQPDDPRWENYESGGGH